VICNERGDIVFACSEKISFVDVNVGEAKAALLGNNPLILEGDSFIVISEGKIVPLPSA
jgi:hypothetical protein